VGYGGIDKSENQLTAFSSAVNTQGAQAQQQVAQAQAASYQAESGYAIQYAQEQADQEQYQIGVTAGNQAQGYASGGVEAMGTPLAVMNTTRALGQLQIDAIQQQGQLQSQLYMTEAANAQQSGLNDLLSSEGQNVAQQQQTNISQAVQNTQALDGLLTAGVSGGVSALSGPVSSFASGLGQGLFGVP